MTFQKITMKDGKLVVPDFPIIPFISGDGIGPEIWTQAQAIFNRAVEVAYGDSRAIQWQEVFAGEKAFQETGEWLPERTLATIREYLVAIKGPLTTPIGGGIRSLNVALRQQLDLYACVRPVRYFEGTPSPMKHPERTNMVVFRENTEDIYAGIEFVSGSQQAHELIEFLQENLQVTSIRFPQTSAIGVKPVSVEGTKRLVRAAFNYAIQQHRKTVTLVHKGNIMKFTEGGFKKWGYEVANEEFAEQTFTWATYEQIKTEKGEEAANQELVAAKEAGKIIVKDCIADIFLEELIARPEDHEIVATLNLNGDYISDALAATVGGVGISPGANINYQTGHAIFEATHGTAPKFAGKNMVNPCSVLLSGALLFRYLGWAEVADAIEAAIEAAIASQKVTFDFARLLPGATEVSLSEFSQQIFDGLAK
ncbi:MAG: NADP-dependent isocitrate dehydrogenase [Enterococcus italicus]|uniref:NADP-dependent isocitrate dehydrogenase n=1 Tax=Enterococcus italicus TaxID=246144 RepID=UPI00399167A3